MADALDPSQSTLSANFAPYVNTMLELGAGAAAQPYQPYTGERFAGPSALQQQAFTGIAGLGTTPSQFGTATQMATQAGTALGGLGYAPTTFGNQYQAPSAYQAGQFGNQFQAPGAYQAADLTQGIGGQSYQGGQFNTQLGPVKSIQDYMSQYTTGVSDIAAREATRQADISRQAEQARLAQAGGYGGSRQAIMEAERQKNLGTQIGDIRTQGLQAAYDRAQQQRLQEAGLGMEAQKATEGSRQFGASFGQQGLEQLLRARQASEASRQFGAQQGMQGAQLGAQYGLAGQEATERSRQFGAQQGMTAAQQAAQYGLAGQEATERSRQFGSEFGLRGLQGQLQAAQALGGLGAQQQQAGISGLDAMLRAGTTQQALEQQKSDFGYQQFQESMKYPYQQATYMQSLLQGLPLEAPRYDSGDSGLSAALTGILGGLGLSQIVGD